MNLIQIGIVLAFQIILFFALGILTSKLLKLHLNSVTVLLTLGFILTLCIFGVIAIPMELTQLPLSTLTYTAMSLFVILIISAIILCRKEAVQIISSFMKGTKEHSYMIVFLLIAIFFQQLAIFNYIDWSADASYYIGKVSTDLHTNTMGIYDPYAGYKLHELNTKRLFTCIEYYNASISQFFQIHPLKQAKLLMPQVLSMFTIILYYQIGLELFDRNKKKADMFVCFVIFLDFFSDALHTSATFLFTRTYEGKSILANILVPGIIYCFILLWKKSKMRFAHVLLFVLAFSSCIFSSSAMLVIPVGITAGMIPWIIKERYWKELLFYLLCIIPNMIVCVVYLFSVKGLISFPIV